MSLSVVAHELLVALGGDNNNIFDSSLDWPKTMETAIHGSFSAWSKLVTFSKFIFTALHWRMTNARTNARIPLASVDFPLNDMAKYCHTEVSYGSLNKEETQKLTEKCRREGVTVTAAISSAILCVSSTLLNNGADQAARLTFTIAADTRRRCIPPLPNHDLSYQVSGVIPFTMSPRDVSTTSEGMWQIARNFRHHLKTSIDAGHVLALGMIMGKSYQMILGPINLAEFPTCGISNWGLLPFCERYGKWELAMMTPFCNTTRFGMPMNLIQTVNGVLTIGHLGAAPLITPSTLEKLRDGTMQNLRQMIED